MDGPEKARLAWGNNNRKTEDNNVWRQTVTEVWLFSKIVIAFCTSSNSQIQHLVISYSLARDGGRRLGNTVRSWLALYD